MRKPANLIYGLDDRPSNGILGGLTLQYIAILSLSLIYPVLIGQAAGVSVLEQINLVSLSMIGTAIGTILQIRRAGPVGSGFLAIPNASSSFLPGSLIAAKLGGMPMVWGMILCASLLQMAIARFLRPLRLLLPTEVAGFIVLVLGVLLGGSGVHYALGEIGQPNLATHLSVAGGTLALIVLASVWGRGFIKLFAALIGIAIGYAVAAYAGLLDPASVRQMVETPWFQWPALGATGLSFSLDLALPIVITSAAVSLSAIGCLTTAQKINDADWRRQELGSISRGVLADGLGSFVTALLGGVALTASASGIALSSTSQATSRVIGYPVAAAFMLLALFPKAIVLVVIMPKAVIGAALLFLSCSFFINGLEIISSRLLDTRKSFTLGISFAAAVAAPQVAPFADIVPGWLSPVLLSPLFLAVSMVLILNPALRLGSRRTESLTLDGVAEPYESISDFVTKAGAAWGARRDVVQRAIDGLTEVVDLLGANLVRIDLGFNELQVDARISYQGERLLLPDTRPTDEDILDAEHGARMLAGYMIGRLANKVSSGERGGMAEIRMAFDH